MSGVKGKDRLMLYTIRSAYTTFNFKGRQENELFREFANACNLTKYTLSGGNQYAHPPQLQTVKKYFEQFLDKTDYENPLDRFRELHRKLFVKLQTFCKPGVECIRGLILFFSYECGLLKSYSELYEGCKYLNENSQWKIVYSEYPEIPEEKIMANLANEELMLYTVICFAYQTYKVSITYSGMKDSFDYFARQLCKIDREYYHGPISVNVPSFRTIRKTFEDYYPVYASRPGPERVIRAYKMIEKENKKGCKAAVHGLLLFLSYYNGLLTTYEEIFEVALALTKYTRPAPVEGQDDFTVLANFDINDIIGSLQAQEVCQMASEADNKRDVKDIKLEEDIEPDITTMYSPDVEFSHDTSTSVEDTSPFIDFKIKQEINDEGENRNPLDETIDLSSNDEEMEIKPCDNTDLINFLAKINDEPGYELQMTAENPYNTGFTDLSKIDVKKEVEDYLSRFNVAQDNADDVVTIEDVDEESQNDIKIEIEESMSYAGAHVVAVENLAPLDLSAFL